MFSVIGRHLHATSLVTVRNNKAVAACLRRNAPSTACHSSNVPKPRNFTGRLLSPSPSRVRRFASAASLVDDIRKKNDENAVVVYSKTWCPYCSQVKELFNKLSIEAKIIELDQVIEGDEVQDALFDLSASRTVPQVFIGGDFVGGGDDVMMMEHSGKLQEKLATVGIKVDKLK